ncbi:DUF1330 domain-containing protein [Nocardia huaxiensis]|uniref:DUF1330 domain-containing protein n=1 Tax=Nocardia huaxiensis TaxID=2755382 RepID=A0A7D6VER6_9NOCA|nr:DUF1330 domain-containing protein [Nocardia huaxiensis]QLY32662.1 DUF1330 domain-containing protein [Nocardia huaxiensis]UFS93605.1 DUF1330 domain-containing protein [Nocardia huaxiensis]
MPGYAIAHLNNIDFNADIVEYLERIDATFTPFGGRFLVHGPGQTVMEGPADSNFVVVEFPTRQAAQDWYNSPAYQAILPLRTANSTGSAVIAEGCGADHIATDILKELQS